MGIGSGFLITADGLIVTNAHVIAGADTISVKFSNSQTKKAKLIGLDKSSDLAVLKVEEGTYITLSSETQTLSE